MYFSFSFADLFESELTPQAPTPKASKPKPTQKAGQSSMFEQWSRSVVDLAKAGGHSVAQVKRHSWDMLKEAWIKRFGTEPTREQLLECRSKEVFDVATVAIVEYWVGNDKEGF